MHLIMQVFTKVTKALSDYINVVYEEPFHFVDAKYEHIPTAIYFLYRQIGNDIENLYVGQTDRNDGIRSRLREHDKKTLPKLTNSRADIRVLVFSLHSSNDLDYCEAFTAVMLSPLTLSKRHPCFKPVSKHD